MPSKFIVKEFATDSYYHVFNRGVNKQVIFQDDHDKQKFLRVLERHLDPKNQDKKNDGLIYKKFDSHLELLSYCLMNNHFHLLFYQKDSEKSLAEFMSSVCTAYVMYFNRRHRRIGPLYQGAYKASRISDDSYLLHISRYIHMNPSNYDSYKWSSLNAFINKQESGWLKPQPILDLFEGDNYLQFLRDYETEKEELELVKSELADSIV